MKKKWFYIVSIVLSVALIATGVVFLFIVNYGVKKPDPVEIVTANSKTYIKTNLNENSSGYIFKFRNGEDEFSFSTKNNMICADNFVNDGTLNLGEKYNISVCYKNDFENGYSNFSAEKEWLASKFLATPSIYVISGYDPNIEADETIFWDSVENADKYVLYYSCGSEMLTYETTQTSVDLSLLVGGKHNFYVVATSSKDMYINSAMSNTVSATSYHEVKAFASAQFNSQTKQLTINTFEDVDEVEVWTGTNQNDASRHHYSYLEGSTTFTKVKTSSGYTYTIKINSYVDETYIAVRPLVSGYNVYNGDFTVAIVS